MQFRDTDWEFLAERSYIPSVDADVTTATDAIYDLVHNVKITSDDVTQLTLLHRLVDGNVQEEHKVVLDKASNGSYFTTIDIVLGLRDIINRWKRLVTGVMGLNEYHRYYGQTHNISVGTPTVLDYTNGNVTLLFEIDGVYQQ